MNNEPGAPPRRWRRRAAITAIVIAVYGVFGFLIAPWILQRELEQRLPAALHRPVSIARVRVNPFALSVTIDGLVVADRTAKAPFLSWDRLYVNARLIPVRTVIKREVALDVLSLSGLQIHVSVGPDGKLDCEDLLEPAAEQPTPPTAQRTSRFVYGVDQLSVERAQIVFVDRSRGRPFETTLGPVTVRLQKFRTRRDSTSPYAFSGVTESGERFSWSGTLLVDPLRSSGEIALEDFRITKYRPYYEQEVGFDLREGRGAFRSRYRFEWGADRHELTVTDGEVHVRDLVLSLRGAEEPAVELPAIDVTGLQADVLGRTAEVGQVAVRGGTVRARRDEEGRVDLTGLVPPATARKEPERPPYRWTIRRVSVSDYRIEVEDALPQRPVSLVLAPIEVELHDLSADPAAVARLEAAVGWNGKGRITAKGTLAPLRPSADLKLQVTGVDLPSLDPYLALYGELAARVPSGQLAVDGRVRVDRGGEPMAWAFEGNVGVSTFALVDEDRGEELARWKNLLVSGIRTASAPPGVAVESIRWEEPRLRLVVGNDRSTNLRRTLGDPQPAAATPAPPVDARPALPVSIGSVQVVRGQAGLVDRSVQPPAVLGLTEIDARLRSLSNHITARSTVAVRALVAGAPLAVNGTLSPRLVNDATDLSVTAKGIDLTPLGPYFARHVGYALDKGKLDLDLAYRVQRRNLDGKNVIRIDQLTLGDRTDSPDATSLPVKLGLAILRDKDGVIDLDVPVSGNVDEPSFSLGKLVWRAITNVFVKVATAPFSALGLLFGGGADQPLDVVEFSPGTAEITAGGTKALETLAKALDGRPGLSMEIEGTADDAADGKALRLRELRNRARHAKWVASGGRSGAAAAEQVELSEEEYRRWVETTYRNAQKEPVSAAKSVEGRAAVASTPVPTSALPPAATITAAPATPPTDEAMEAMLAAATVIPPETMPALAQQRAEAVLQRLGAAKPPIDPIRLFLVQGGERAAKERGARAYFTLK